MTAPAPPGSLEQQIDHWRAFLQRRATIGTADVARLESQLREQIARLGAAGLAPDEAFLVALKRMGSSSAASREFAREHSERLWNALVSADASERRAGERFDAVVAFGLAVAAAALIKLPALFGVSLDEDGDFYVRNASLLILPLLTGYFVWKRRLAWRTVGWLAAALLAAAVIMNTYPFVRPGSTEALAALHLPIALWLVVGVAYAGGRWSQAAARMDFVRFSGELLIYFVLIGIGGAVLMGFMAMIFQAIGIDVEPFIGNWWVPCGAAGAVLVASWLVEAKQSVIESMAPVLTRLFTPLFAAVLIVFVGTVLWTGRGIDIEREVLIAFDLLLVAVIALLLYSASARDPQRPPNVLDLVQIALVVSALAANAVALTAIATRITEYGFTPNRVAALGENVILLVNLVWSAVLYLRFVRGRGPFVALERWQTNYIPVYAAWAAIVVAVFPLVFRFS